MELGVIWERLTGLSAGVAPRPVEGGDLVGLGVYWLAPLSRMS